MVSYNLETASHTNTFYSYIRISFDIYAVSIGSHCLVSYATCKYLLQSFSNLMQSFHFSDCIQSETLLMLYASAAAMNNLWSFHWLNSLVLVFDRVTFLSM